MAKKKAETQDENQILEQQEAVATELGAAAESQEGAVEVAADFAAAVLEMEEDVTHAKSSTPVIEEADDGADETQEGDPLLEVLEENFNEEGDFSVASEDDSLADSLLSGEGDEELVDDDINELTAPLTGDTDDQLAEIEYRAAKAKAPTVFNTKMAKASQATYVNAVLARDRRDSNLRSREVIDAKMISTWQTIKLDYQQQRTVYKARIIGSKMVGKIPCAIIRLYDTFNGYIPFTELWVNVPANAYPKKDETTSSFQTRILTMINDMSSATESMSVIVTQAVYRDDRFAIIASRRMALLRNIASFYKSPDETGTRKHTKVGDMVSATVVSVSSNKAVLNVRGVDIRVPFTRITCRYQPKFAPGDTVMVRVQSIDWPSEDHYNVHLKQDYKRLQENVEKAVPNSAAYKRARSELKKDRLYRIPRIQVDGRPDEVRDLYARNGHQLSRGDRCLAYITNLTFSQKTGTSYAWLWLNDFKLAAFAMTSGNVELGVGSMVDFVVDGVANHELPYFRGRITRVYNKAEG